MITILKPGLLTTIQDLGRYGFQKYGVIVSGAMDATAHIIANLLVGNNQFMPTLEITLVGPAVQFKEDSLISICGGDLSPEINGKFVSTWRTIFVEKDSILTFGKAISGCRAYLAVSGGFAVPSVMNSYSTYLRAEIGGYFGKALQAGDSLQYGKASELAKRWSEKLKKKQCINGMVEEKWTIAPTMISSYQKDISVHLLKGREFFLFSKESQCKLFQEEFTISSKSDRMGYRLQGEALFLEKQQEMISEAVDFGTIQVPADGNPIILLADRQTIGGYPKIGQIATVDFSSLAQAKPNDRLRFTEINHHDAQILLLKRQQEMKQLSKGIYYNVIMGGT
ncbi:MAG: biotin-dependent carboxyltransferase family protein [Bacillus sp. (in: firmicutes)]